MFVFLNVLSMFVCVLKCAHVEASGGYWILCSITLLSVSH